jgi:hypothetical protein
MLFAKPCPRVFAARITWGDGRSFGRNSFMMPSMRSSRVSSVAAEMGSADMATLLVKNAVYGFSSPPHPITCTRRFPTQVTAASQGVPPQRESELAGCAAEARAVRVQCDYRGATRP